MGKVIDTLSSRGNVRNNNNMPGAVCMHACARIYANYNDNFIGTGQGWRIKFQIDTNLHLKTSASTAGYYKCFNIIYHYNLTALQIDINIGLV